MRSGIAYYMDGLLSALYEQTSSDEIRAFAPVGAQATMDLMQREGCFSWWRTPDEAKRLDLAGNVGPLPPPSGKLVEQMQFRSRRKWSMIQTQKAADQYDLMHFPAPTYLPAGRYAPKHNIVTLHDMTVRTHAFGHVPDNVRSWEEFFVFAQNRCERIVTVSEASKREIMEHLKISSDRIIVAPNGPRQATGPMPPSLERNLLLKSCGLEPGEPFVLYAGTIEPRKNCDRLLRGFARTVNEVPALRECKVVLSGGVWMGLDKKMREIADEEGIADNLIQTGYVTDAQMNAMMSACTAFIYISLVEGFGMPPLEAMLCGAPVITSNCSSMPEVVGNAGVLVDPTKITSIAEGLHTLLTDESENKRRRVLSLQQAKQFTWDRAAKITLRAYEEAVAGG